VKISIHIIVFAAIAFTPLLAMPQASAPGKLNPRATPTPTPTAARTVFLSGPLGCQPF